MVVVGWQRVESRGARERLFLMLASSYVFFNFSETMFLYNK